MRRSVPLPTRMERWSTPDDDFLDLHRLDAPAGRPRLLVLHGLEEARSETLVDEETAEVEERPAFATLEKREDGIP